VSGDAAAEGDAAASRAVRLGAWLAARGLTGPEVTWSRISGGHSNLTDRVVDTAGRSVVLRRPPPTAHEHGAHDVVREGAIVAALAGTDVPVPAVLGTEDDPRPLGAPFLVMEDVPGTVVRTGSEAAALGPAGPAAARDHAAVLARLHRLDPAGLPLPAALHRRLGTDGADVTRLLDRWGAQVPRARPAHRDLLGRTLSALRARRPAPVAVRLLHGDYRLDNVVIDPSTGRVRAVLDWELATVGDPRTDLGSLLAVWTATDDPFHPLPDPPSHAPGMPDGDALVAAYAEVTGTAPTDLGYFTALALWKYACIVEGVQRRLADGAPAGGPDLGDLTAPLATRALELLARPRRGPGASAEREPAPVDGQERPGDVRGGG